MDHMRKGTLRLDRLQALVLDEADEMLNMGFKEQLNDILGNTPDDKQVLLFSATMSSPIRKIASNYMHKPDEITVGTKNTGSDNVKHFYYVAHERDRYQVLRRIADANPDIHGIVFCRTRRETQRIADRLIQDHYSAEAIHGEVTQEQRTHVMNRFKEKKIQLLVATDVAARGIDVDKLTHVINYNLPDSDEAYVHRSGRTGRAHNDGVSLVIVNMRETYKIRHLEKKVGKRFEKGKIPSGEDICEKQLFSLIDKFCETKVDEDRIGKYLDLINKKFEDIDRDELIRKIISVEFNKFLDHYKNAVDLNSRASSGDRRGHVGRDRRDGDRRGNERGGRSKPSILFARLKISVGRQHGLGVKDLFSFINEQSGMTGIEIGNIDINTDHTLLEVDEKLAKKLVSFFDGAEMDGDIVKATIEATGIQSTRDERGGGRGRSGGNRGGNRRSGGGGYKGGGSRRGGSGGGRNKRPSGSRSSGGYDRRKF